MRCFPCHRYLYALLAITVGAYAGTIGLTAVLFYFFNPGGADCSFNITAIVLTLLLGLVMSALSVSVYVRGPPPRLQAAAVPLPSCAGQC